MLDVNFGIAKMGKAFPNRIFVVIACPVHLIPVRNFSQLSIHPEWENRRIRVDRKGSFEVQEDADYL